MDALNARIGTCLVAAVIALCGLPAQPAHAGGSTTSIFGGRRNAMLTVMGRPDDLSALFHNPAGLADLKGTRGLFFFSPAFLSTGFRMQALDGARFPAINPAGCGVGNSAPCPWPTDAEGYYTREVRPEKYFGIIPFLAGSTDLGFLGPAGRDIVVSGAIYSPNFYGAFLPEDAPTAYQIIGGYFMVISGTLGVGWRINRYLAVGANLSYNYMRLTLAQRMSLANSLTPPGETPQGLALVAQGLIGDIRMDYDGTEHGVGWTASLLLTPLSWLGIGFTYAGNTSPRFQGDVSFSAYNKQVKDEAAFRRLVATVGYKLPRELIIGQAIPHAIFFGVNVALGAQVEVGVDARLWFYNAYSRQVITPIYDPAEPGSEPLSEESLSSDKNFKLSWQVTAGVLVRPLKSYPQLELMLGGGYDQSPIPDETFTLDNPNLSHAKVAGGVRWRINESWRLTLSYLLNLYISRDIRNSQTKIPTNVQVSSHSHSPAITVEFLH